VASFFGVFVFFYNWERGKTMNFEEPEEEA
jgi:hypothetical protein